jgi:hypothetical protein
VQLDEMWTFLTCKQKNVTPEIAAKNPDAGDLWLWVGLCAESKPCSHDASVSGTVKPRARS